MKPINFLSGQSRKHVFAGIYGPDDKLVGIRQLYAEQGVDFKSGRVVYHWDCAVQSPKRFAEDFAAHSGGKVIQLPFQYQGSPSWGVQFQEGDFSFSIRLTSEKFSGWRPAGIPDKK